MNAISPHPAASAARPLAIAAAALVALIALTVPVALGIAIPGDWALTEWALAQRSDALTQPIWLLTFITSATPALLICVAASTVELSRMRRRHRNQPIARLWVAAWPALAFLGALACNIALRIAIGRMRPAVEYIPHGLPELQADFQRFSYPSGHAGSATVAYLVLVALAWPHRRLRRAVLAGALIVILGAGFGRFYLGVHWPTDVLAGYLLGGMWVSLGIAARLAWGRADGPDRG